MMEEYNRNCGSIPGKGKEVFSSTNYEAGRGAHPPSSYSLGNLFPRIKRLKVKLTSHRNLPPIFRISGVITP